MSFRSDFAGFVGGAILCSLPVMSFVSVQAFEDGAAGNAKDPLLLYSTEATDSRGLEANRRYQHAGVASGRHLQALSRPAATLCGVEPDFYWSLILRESGGRHYADDGSVLRSKAGAVGAAQVKPSTARELGLDAFDVWENLLAGACALRGHYDASGSWEKALHSYHAGRWRKRTTAATRAYAEDVMGGTQ